MDTTLVRIFVISFVSSRLSCVVSGLDTTIGHFQVFQKHPNLIKCSGAVLRESEYVGGRVSEMTDECQGLSHTWGLNQTLESGYAYAKKMFVQENFQPPIRGRSEPVTWTIPGVLNAGAELDLFVTIKDLDNSEGTVKFNLTDMSGEYITLRIESDQIRISERINEGPFEMQPLGYQDLDTSTPTGMVKVSFLARTDNVTILLDEKRLTQLGLKRSLEGKRHISVTESDTESDTVFIHRIQYTAK